MKYPYLIFDDEIALEPIFKGLKGAPFIADMSYQNPVFSEMDVRDQGKYQKLLETQMGPDYEWGVAGYLERRDTLLSSCPQMVEEKRFFHLGLDVIVPKGKKLFVPLDATVWETGYEEGEGNYGGFILLKHDSTYFDTFYSLYGHLSHSSLPPVHQKLKAGDEFARIGDFHENGNWFHHTHIQVITQEGLNQGYLSKGYCSATDLVDINELCPSPLSLFRI